MHTHTLTNACGHTSMHGHSCTHSTHKRLKLESGPNSICPMLPRTHEAEGGPHEGGTTSPPASSAHPLALWPLDPSACWPTPPDCSNGRKQGTCGSGGGGDITEGGPLGQRCLSTHPKSRTPSHSVPSVTQAWQADPQKVRVTVNSVIVKGRVQPTVCKWLLTLQTIIEHQLCASPVPSALSMVYSIVTVTLNMPIYRGGCNTFPGTHGRSKN